VQILLPHRVEYLTTKPVPIEDVIGTLQAQQRIASDFGRLLERLADGVKVDRVELWIRSIETSSLKEKLLVALFLTYQSDLQTAVPTLIERWTGLSIDERYDALVTITFLCLLFYGAEYAYKRLTDHLGSERIRKALDDATEELAYLAGKPKPEVREVIEKYFKKKGRAKEIAKAAIKFFRPSRNQNNDPILVGDKTIETAVIKEVPNQVDLSELDKHETSLPIYGTRVKLRAKDHDHEGSGWAGIVEVVSSERKPLRLYPHVDKEFLWKRDEVWADVLVTYRHYPDGPRPVRYHIMTAYGKPSDIPPTDRSEKELE